ncbi:MAG: hypothetical protein K0Q52_3126 [Microbacterium sp.]|nr:hypothetical protein [Microbacterium sp.]
MGLHPEQTTRTHRYSEAFTADARGTLGHQPASPQYKDWAGTPAPSAYAWSPDWAVGTTSGLGQAGLSITGTATMISIGGEFRSVNNGQFEGIVRFSTAPPGGAKDKPRLSGDKWTGAAAPSPAGAAGVTVTIPANWDRDDLTLTYELRRAGTSTPVATTTADATWWKRPQITLVDATAPRGALQEYTVVAKDADGNTATSAALSATATAPDSTPPTPATTDDPITIVARESGKAVGVSGTASPAVQQPVSGSTSQEWTVVPKANGKFQLKNEATGACLAVSLSAKVLAGHAQVLQWTCADQAHFLWSLKDLGNGYSQLVASHSGQCLTLLGGNTADGANYIQNECTATPSTFSQFTLPAAA